MSPLVNVIKELQSMEIQNSETIKMTINFEKIFSDTYTRNAGEVLSTPSTIVKAL
jgi:hypothetical protein